MLKKKSKRKPVAVTSAKKSGAKGKKNNLNPAEVRKDISKLVESHASKMAEAVIGEGEKGQLATVKYLFEMANIFPAPTDGSEVSQDEECLAKTLLRRLDIPETPVAADQDDEDTAVPPPQTSEEKSEEAAEEKRKEECADEEREEVMV